MEKATFGAGCFWGVEAAFRRLPGVASTAVGYMGGVVENPTYPQVCSDTTGYAEVVEVIYDPAMVSYERLLEVFWTIHDPTVLNRQGPDIGSQYRSVIFTHDAAQQAAALAAKARRQQSGGHRGTIVTEIAPAAPFYRAEAYHQHYLEKHGHSSGG